MPAQECILLGQDDQLNRNSSFLYMPFMHSESRLIHEQALQLFETLGNPINLDFEKKHKMIIDRFGRYPHRNAILGRKSTAEEIEFFKTAQQQFLISKSCCRYPVCSSILHQLNNIIFKRSLKNISFFNDRIFQSFQPVWISTVEHST